VKRLLLFGFAAAAAMMPMASAVATNNTPNLVDTVRDATASMRDPAGAVGYTSTGACVSGPQEGAMGVHFANDEQLGNATIDARHPELLVYEPRNGKLRLVGVEYLVIADDWNAAHTQNEPPVLMGQQFQFVNSPNRYRLPAFYELHVWAWKSNPLGMFADFNANVSCEQYTGEANAAGGHGAHG
jgi:hypothetical protein